MRCACVRHVVDTVRPSAIEQALKVVEPAVLPFVLLLLWSALLYHPDTAPRGLQGMPTSHSCVSCSCARACLCLSCALLLLLLLLQGHPVWRQLEEICDSSAACLRARLQRQNAELAAHKAEIARLQQQLEERDAHVEQLQQQLAERGEDDEGVVELQQELSGLHVRGDGGQ